MGKLKPEKAAEMLKNPPYGRALTDSQKKYFSDIVATEPPTLPNVPKMGGWLNKYKDGGPVQENYNDAKVSTPPGFVGQGYDTKGRNYSPAWGGQFQDGGFLQPTSYKLPSAAYAGGMSSEISTSIGGEQGEPAYLIPTFKHGKPLKDPEAEYRKTGEHLGGPFKTWQEAEKFGEMRHKYVEKGQDIPSPYKFWGDMAMGGGIPGAVGFTYARVAGSAPANGKYTKKTKASAQNGKEMKFYQEGLDFKPKTISKNGSVIKDDMGQWAHPGEITEIGSNEITMQGVDYPVLGISDTGDRKLMQPGEDYKFKGKKVTEYPMAQDGDWLKKYATEPMRQDATRNVIPRKMTDKERLEATANSDQAQKRALNTAKEVLKERQTNRQTKGDLNTPGSWHIEDKLRMFPNSVGGAGEVFDEYVNPATYVGVLADALGESATARDPKAVALSLGLAAGTGLLGMDPLGSAIKGVKSLKSAGKTALSKTTDNKVQQSMLSDVAAIPNYIGRVAKSTKSLGEEVLGEYFRGDANREAIAKGNEWMKNWVDNPTTKEKLKNQIINQKILGKQNPKIASDINDFSVMESYNSMTNYNPVASEYPLKDQFSDYMKILKNDKIRPGMIHEGNAGVSYRHSNPEWYDMTEYFPGRRASGPGTWISRSPQISDKGRTSVTIHEGAHDWLRDQPLNTMGYSDAIKGTLTQDATDAYSKWIDADYRGSGLGYLADPTEVHARIMQARHHFGLTPDMKVTPEMATDMLKKIKQGKTPINSSFSKVFDDPKKVAQLFNNLPAAAPVAVGAAALASSKENKNGGWLNKYK